MEPPLAQLSPPPPPPPPGKVEQGMRECERRESFKKQREERNEALSGCAQSGSREGLSLSRARASLPPSWSRG